MIAATDAAMEEQYLATQWIISTNDNELEYRGGVQGTWFFCLFSFLIFFCSFFITETIDRKISLVIVKYR